MTFYPIDFIAPFNTLFDCNDEFTPSVYVGSEELEYNKSYTVKLKYIYSKPPSKREKGSTVAIYALFYKFATNERPTIKIGSISTSSLNCAAMLWAQAPLHARIIGVFRLTKTIKLEHLEEICVKILKNDKLSKQFRFTTKLPETIKILSMWNGLESFNINDYIENLKEINNILLDNLTKLEYLELLYYDNMWLEPPKQNLKIDLMSKKLSELKKENGVFKGTLIITPVGLCIFKRVINGQFKTYVDIGRKFAYNTFVSIEEKGS
jgi:hypothetical protein